MPVLLTLLGSRSQPICINSSECAGSGERYVLAWLQVLSIGYCLYALSSTEGDDGVSGQGCCDMLEQGVQLMSICADSAC